MEISGKLLEFSNPTCKSHYAGLQSDVLSPIEIQPELSDPTVGLFSHLQPAFKMTNSVTNVLRRLSNAFKLKQTVQ